VIEAEGKVRSLLVLEPRGGDYAQLLEFFRRNDVLGLAIREAGAWSAEVQVPMAGVGPVLVTALWDSEEAYAGWRNHPVRTTFSDDMARLTEPAAPQIDSGVYRIAIAAVRT
jgi:hypothetical protein